MKTVLTIPKTIYLELRKHLFPTPVESEEAAMIFVTVSEETDLLFNYVDWYPVPPSEFSFRSMGHIELDDANRGKIIKKAHDLNAGIVEVHSHPYRFDAEFSGSDRWGFREYVPHVMWRLKGRPYVALVFAPKNFDALVWIDSLEDPIALDELKVGSTVLKPTNLSLDERRWYDSRDEI